MNDGSTTYRVVPGTGSDGGLILYAGTRFVFLTNTLAWTLYVLMSHTGEVLSSPEIQRLAEEGSKSPLPWSVSTIIRKLSAKLHPLGAGRWIQMVPGRGYGFAPPEGFAMLGGLVLPRDAKEYRQKKSAAPKKKPEMPRSSRMSPRARLFGS